MPPVIMSPTDKLYYSLAVLALAVAVLTAPLLFFLRRIRPAKPVRWRPIVCVYLLLILAAVLWLLV